MNSFTYAKCFIHKLTHLPLKLSFEVFKYTQRQSTFFLKKQKNDIAFAKYLFELEDTISQA